LIITIYYAEEQLKNLLVYNYQLVLIHYDNRND
jgi:hypothetical protein